MHRFSRMHLSPEVALHILDAIDLEEKSRITEGIALIAVIDERKDYLAAGYSCMRSYCMGRLHMSEDKALRRIQVARVAMRFPEVFEYLADGRLSVTTAAVLAPYLDPETASALLAAAAFRTKHEIARMLFETSRPSVAPSDAPAHESLVQTTSCQHAPAHADSYFALSAPPAGDSTPGEQGSVQRQAHLENSCRGRVSPFASGDFDLRMRITAAEYEDLRRTQALLGHAVPTGDPALVYARAMKHYLAHLEKQRLGVKPGAAVRVADASSRSIPRPLRRLVWERDGGRCRFVGTDGHRCEETGRLELDHITPVARGGETSAENLRVLCAAHNRYEAERVLGKEHVQRRREIAQRERARVKGAARAGEARAQARDAVRRARYDDIRSALRGLGASDAEARRCAALVDAMPDASLEECMKAALTELARPAALRGERRARCTA